MSRRASGLRRPAVATPRPVLLNTWEAVYFDHSHERLWDLADRAAELGIERFVLDDGWFGGRRNDRAGLGDWWVSPNVYPDGLGPLIDHVTGLGLEFGLWVEPEMVNPDSELFRARAEWALVTPGYEPVLGRQQLVLNLAHPDAFAHILAALDGLLADHAIGYLKWDMSAHRTGTFPHHWPDPPAVVSGGDRAVRPPGGGVEPRRARDRNGGATRRGDRAPQAVPAAAP